jgi:uncharacterized FAD-dependent dehydrogenase
MSSNNQIYDVLIVGAGPSGIFTAFEAKKNNPDLRVLMIEKGRSIEKRKCPKRITGVCADCEPCAITTGFSGSGSFSDGKLSISYDGEVGGELIRYIGPGPFRSVLQYTDDLYVHFGADPQVHGLTSTPTIDQIRHKAAQAHLKLVESGVRHMGTEKAYDIYSRIQKALEELQIEMCFNTVVEDFILEDLPEGGKKIVGVTTADNHQVRADKVVVGIGREGSEWLSLLGRKYGIKAKVGQVDIGVRVETDANITTEIDNSLYEAKLIYYTKTFEDRVRTFCWNPKGVVAEEKYGKLAVVNGHSYKDQSLKTKNTNFALLVSKTFTEPFNTPIEYGHYIAELGNMLSGGKVLLQRYGDLKRGRRTTSSRMIKNIVQPTLKDAVAGDLSLVLPYRIMIDIIETLEALDSIMPGIASDSTLLYGVEVKFYSNKFVVDSHFETNIKNLHVLGDGAGLTRGLMQASMNGVCMGRMLTGVWQNGNGVDIPNNH